MDYSVGGATEDVLRWSSNVNGVQANFPPIPNVITSTKQLFPEATSGKIGGDWYRLSANLPVGTRFIWGVNLAAGSTDEVITQVRSIRDAFSVSDSGLGQMHYVLTNFRTPVSSQCHLKLLRWGMR